MKIYKGWELIRDIAEGKIKEDSKFNVYEDKEMYFDRPVIYANGVLRHNGTLLTEFISLAKITQLGFEPIEEQQDIDIQAIEEFIVPENPSLTIINEYNIKKIIKRLNEHTQALKQLDRKIKEVVNEEE